MEKKLLTWRNLVGILQRPKELAGQNTAGRCNLLMHSNVYIATATGTGLLG